VVTLADTAATGPLAMATLAGVASFFAPCMLPLVPGYLSYVTGLTGTELPATRRWRTLADAGLFVAGFTAVFTLMAYAAGRSAGSCSSTPAPSKSLSCALTIVLGRAFAATIKEAGYAATWEQP
jgi:cytochrome c-type biogenesis protein